MSFILKVLQKLNKLINQFEGKLDPDNNGKVFKFNFLPDFILNNRQKKLSFAYVCSKISLPMKLTFANKSNCDGR